MVPLRSQLLTTLSAVLALYRTKLPSPFSMLRSRETSAASPSANWHTLQKMLKPGTTKGLARDANPRKKRKLSHDAQLPEGGSSALAFPRGDVPATPSTSTLPDELKNGESLASLRKTVAGSVDYTDAQQLPGKYLALDCEMVGVGIEGRESSLARVSLVNYHGAVQLDEFVRQREHVVDYRTEFSGIRPKDMIRAKPFVEVQKLVADLLKDRILVGHAVHNDLKALLLSHPYTLTRDTQVLAHKHKLMNAKRPALRHLVKQELGITIQSGEHSSVTDARATMAVYRIHRKTWDKGFPHIPPTLTPKKRSAQEAGIERDEEDEAPSGERGTAAQYPGGGRKGVSSGLSVVMKRKETKTKSGWWKELGQASRL